VLAGGNMEVETLAEIEVSNFDIMGGDHAISSPTGVGDVNINRLAISDANDHAIELTPLTETIANGTMRSRFTPTINDVTFTNIGDGLDGDDDDIHLAATTVETTIVETITVSDITSDDGEGHGINLLSPNRAATLTNINWDGGTTGAGGIRIQDAQAQGNVTLNGTNSFTGGETGTPDATGFAIALLNSAGTHTVTGTTITNMGGDSVIVNDGASNLNFTGRIEQTANNASVLSAGGEHTGTVTFTELTANAGVIEATTGDGLQFDDADGVYTFNDLVELAGTSMGVNAVNDSEAVLTFQNAEITNTTGVALNFDGGDANMTLTGRIEQTANNAAVLNVSNEHTGTLVLNEITANQGVIESTTGPGLVFDNADGAYTFNDEVLLNGGNAHVDVSNDSEGTFTFADGNITMGAASTDAAVVIDGSSAIFTYTGDITANSAATADAVVLNANTGGSVTFNSTVTGDEGVTVSNNSGGTFAFAGQVTLTGTSNGVEITNNTGGSTSFSNIDITKTGAGTGFVATSAAAGHTVTVTGASNTISTQTGVALNLDTIAVGGAGINFQSVSSDGAVNGITLNSLTGGAVNIGAGGAAAGAGGSILNSQQNGIVITNAANVSLNRMIVEGTNAAFDGIDVNHTNAATSTVSITNSEVHDGAIGIDYNRSASATSRLTLTSNIVDTVAAEGVAIDINGSGTSNITINGANQVTAGGDEALLLTTSGGSGKTVNVLVDDGQFMNNSAAVSAANVQANGTGTINATVTFNTFTNNNAAGTALVMNTNSPVALIRLNLDQNSSVVANGAATDTILDVTAGDFRVLDLADVDTRNVGDESIDPAIVDDPGPIPTP